MKVFITGGAGYVGSALVNALQHKHGISEVIVYDNLSRQHFGLFTQQQINGVPTRFVQGDILDNRKLKKSIDGSDAVIHLAARVTTPFADSDAHQFDQINHWGTTQLVDAIKQTPSVRQAVFISSASVYGNTNGIVDEDHRLDPRTFYGLSKLAAEKEWQRLPDRRVFILRSGNVFGYSPALRIDAVINKFMFEAQFNGRISIFGDGEQKRPFVHIRTLCEIIKSIMSDDALEPGTYNVVRENLSVLDIVDRLKHLYPDLETVFVNRSQKMRSLELEQPSRLSQKLDLGKTSFLDQLREFQSQFSFRR